MSNSIKNGDSVLIIESNRIGIVIRNNPFYEHPLLVEFDNGDELEFKLDQVELSSDDLDEDGYPYQESPRRGVK